MSIAAGEVPISTPPQGEQLGCAGSHIGGLGDRGMEEKL